MYTITTTNNNLAASNRVITCVEPETFCVECGCDLTPENWAGGPETWATRFEYRRCDQECLGCCNRIEPDDHPYGFDPQD
jgi:hypothetical protein